MKKVKIVLWIILIGIIAVIVYSNKNYFFDTKQSIQILVPFKEPYTFKEMPNAVYFLIFFVIGFFIAYFFSLAERFKSKKTIKNLNAAATSQLDEISTLKKEVNSLKASASSNKAAPEKDNITFYKT
jgi:uncharacterized membrane protein